MIRSLTHDLQTTHVIFTRTDLFAFGIGSTGGRPGLVYYRVGFAGPGKTPPEALVTTTLLVEDFELARSELGRDYPITGFPSALRFDPHFPRSGEMCKDLFSFPLVLHEHEGQATEVSVIARPPFRLPSGTILWKGQNQRRIIVRDESHEPAVHLLLTPPPPGSASHQWNVTALNFPRPSMSAQTC